MKHYQDVLFDKLPSPAAFGRLCVETVFSGKKLAMD